jgi:hypothetical protein
MSAGEKIPVEPSSEGDAEPQTSGLDGGSRHQPDSPAHGSVDIVLTTTIIGTVVGFLQGKNDAKSPDLSEGNE